MARTTINIDGPLLRDLKRLQKAEQKPLGRIISDLLAEALGRRSSGTAKPVPFKWTARPLIARVDLSDKEAVRRALEEDRQE